MIGGYQVGFEDLKYLVDGLEAEGFTRDGAIRWCRENKQEITPEFMEEVCANPDGFFYCETRLRFEEDLARLDLRDSRGIEELIESVE